MEGRSKRKESLTFHSEIAQARPVVPLFEIAALRRRYRSVTPPVTSPRPSPPRGARRGGGAPAGVAGSEAKERS